MMDTCHTPWALRQETLSSGFVIGYLKQTCSATDTSQNIEIFPVATGVINLNFYVFTWILRDNVFTHLSEGSSEVLVWQWSRCLSFVVVHPHFQSSISISVKSVGQFDQISCKASSGLELWLPLQHISSLRLILGKSSLKP